jgi:hypothetical protein
VRTRARCAPLSVVAVVLTLLAGAVVASPALAGGDATESACPNEASPGFRAYLPECRAYEMVSPPYKQGFPVVAAGYSENDLVGSGVDGAPLVWGTSLGAFAGGPDSLSFGEGNDYRFKRSQSGWDTVAVDPQLGQYVGNPAYSPIGSEVLATTGDGTSLLDLHQPSQSIYVNDLYLRTLAGSFSRIGPMLPQSAIPAEPTGVIQNAAGRVAIAGSSADLSHVLFYVTDQERPSEATTSFWPGDATLSELGEASIARSLYEYSGTDNAEPQLVGVTNSGPLNGQPHINEGAQLVSRCGIHLGGRDGGSTHNAMSANGAVVFFTANPACPNGGPGSGPPAFELFVRLHGERTVALSEPTPTECGSSSACAEAPIADANFEGASEDGAKVFFTSTQQLLPTAVEDETAEDSAVRRGCSETVGQNGCNLYAYDFNRPAGQSLQLVSGGAVGGSGAQVQGVAALAEDGSHTYFVAKGVLAANAGAATDSLSGLPQRATAGAENLYLSECDARYPECHTSFVATLSASDSFQWSSSGESPMTSTPDGRFLVFYSRADLTPDDSSTALQIFRYDAQRNELVRVSIGNNGYNENGNTNVFNAFIPSSGYASAQVVGRDAHRAVSNDGSIVVFASADALTPGAMTGPTNAVKNVYEYRDGHVYLISDGRTVVGSVLLYRGAKPLGVSSSGRDILFATYGSLVPQDQDVLGDIYDARVDGGFPAPAEGVACTGGSCQSPLNAAPSLALAGSATTVGGGDLTPPTSTPVKRKARPKHKTRRPKRLRSPRRKKHRQTHVRSSAKGGRRGK